MPVNTHAMTLISVPRLSLRFISEATVVIIEEQ
jgi:hypothetical protein